MKLDDVPTVLLVASGKGGVGKTTVSSDIAQYLTEQGLKVGVIDADISTPNTPDVLAGGEADFSDQRLSDGENLLPVHVNGIQLVSQGIDLPDDVVLLRDGSFRAESVAEYIKFVEWDDDTDVVVVDSPPGSGEEVQTILSAAEPDHTFIVTTPHDSSLMDAHRTHQLMEQAEVDHSVVANMTHIPGGDVLEHVWDAEAVEDVQGIGDAKAEALYDVLEASVEDLPLFASDDDIEEAVGADLTVGVPYSGDDEYRRSHYGAIRELVGLDNEVEA